MWYEEPRYADEAAKLLADVRKFTAAKYAAWCKRLGTPARMDWFDDFPNTLLPFEKELGAQSHPLARRIDASVVTERARGLCYDTKGRLIALCDGPAAAPVFRWQYIYAKDTVTEVRYNPPKPGALGLVRVWLREGRPMRACGVHPSQDPALPRYPVWWIEYTYDAGRLQRIARKGGTYFPNLEFKLGYPQQSVVHVELAADGTLLGLYGESDGKRRAIYQPPPPKPPKKLRAEFAAALAKQVERSVVAARAKKVVAVALIYNSAVWHVPSLALLTESDLESESRDLLFQPIEWGDAAELDLDSQELDQLATALMAAKHEEPIDVTLATVARQLTKRLRKVLDTGPFFACFAYDFETSTPAATLLAYYTKADQKKLEA